MKKTAQNKAQRKSPNGQAKLFGCLAYLAVWPFSQVMNQMGEFCV
jgi:hypothetical protein